MNNINTVYNLVDGRHKSLHPPFNIVEDKIKLLLVMEGYDRHRISFRGKNRRYIVYKYWEPINDHSLEYVSIHTNAVFNIEEIYDDDCGWLYSYNIKERN